MLYKHSAINHNNSSLWSLSFPQPDLKVDESTKWEHWGGR